MAIVFAVVAFPYISALIAQAAGNAAAAATFAATGGDLCAAGFAGAAAASSPWVAAVAGSITGAVSGAIVGGGKGAAIGALTGAMFGGISGHYGGAWNAGRVAYSGAAGGISSSLSGQSFWRGFGVALGFSLTSWWYESVVQDRYEAKWTGGHGHQDKPGLFDPPGTPAEAIGASGDYNHFGFAWSAKPGMDSAPGWFYETGKASSLIDRIYGANAGAVFHDNLMAQIFSSVGRGAYRWAFIPTIPTAAITTYATLVGPGNAIILDSN
ncbi:MAG: hypothetical protein U1F35_08730 [Steroidobacteraceae bacterium]